MPMSLRATRHGRNGYDERLSEKDGKRNESSVSWQDDMISPVFNSAPLMQGAVLFYFVPFFSPLVGFYLWNMIRFGASKFTGAQRLFFPSIV